MFGSIVSGGQRGYQIQKSLRFRASALAYLSRTFGTPTNNKIWTWSGWVKRGAIGGAPRAIFGTTDNNLVSANVLTMRFEAADTLSVLDYSSAYQLQLSTTQVFRDPSAHYHIVLTVDTTQATAANRVKLYVNGSQVTALTIATYPAQNYNTYWNSAIAHYQGAYNNSSSGTLAHFDGYISEVNFVDGQALTPDAFGYIDPVTTQWAAKKYTGTYGANGFYLPFTDNTALTTASNVGIGKDFSGNGNYWITNNVSITAGATYDSMLDVPQAYGTSDRGNYCSVNTAFPNPNSGTYSEAGLLMTSLNNGNAFASRGTIWVNTGKFYFEGEGISSGGYGQTSIGVIDESGNVGYKWIGNLGDSGYTTYGTYGAAFDASNGKVWMRDSTGTWVGSGDPITGLNPTFTMAAGAWLTPLCATGRTSGFVNSGIGRYNFGQRPFTHAAPAGFKSLHTGNLPAPAIINPKKHFDIAKWTGNGADATISTDGNGNALQLGPDMVWAKSRTTVADHIIGDRVRTVTTSLFTNLTSAEVPGHGSIAALNSNGFNVAAGLIANTVNYVGWMWKAGGTAVSNKDGSIISQVSVNRPAGFSIVTYTGTSIPGTVGHGLGVSPKMVIVKSRTGGTSSWVVWHTALAGTEYLLLETTGAKATAATVWNSTVPTPNAFSVHSGSVPNTADWTYVAYCFAEVLGYSKFGSYTGNGSVDGPFVYCGFRPRFVMIKRSDSISDWRIIDTTRDTFNAASAQIYPNLTNAEATAVMLDITANGFKVRNTDTGYNANSGTYIYMAIAEVPFGFGNAR